MRGFVGRAAGHIVGGAGGRSFGGGGYVHPVAFHPAIHDFFRPREFAGHGFGFHPWFFRGLWPYSCFWPLCPPPPLLVGPACFVPPVPFDPTLAAYAPADPGGYQVADFSPPIFDWRYLGLLPTIATIGRVSHAYPRDIRPVPAPLRPEPVLPVSRVVSTTSSVIPSVGGVTAGLGARVAAIGRSDTEVVGATSQAGEHLISAGNKTEATLVALNNAASSPYPASDQLALAKASLETTHDIFTGANNQMREVASRIRQQTPDSPSPSMA